VQDRVAFEGAVTASAVVGLMRASDVVLIPSRTSFPEGLPLVLEHSLCARTPAVVSAHPAFAGSLEHRADSMLFPPGDTAALAACVRELLDDPALYERISSAAPATWGRLQARLLWHELIEAWLAGTPESLSRLRARSAAADP
jgi:glycosyltransferase involved in cell wall biosynthesis